MKRLLQSILSLLFFAVLLELACRLYLFGLAGLSNEAVKSVRLIGRSGLVQPSPYREVLYELRPNLDAEFKMAPLKTNSAGLPDREYARRKPPNTFRVAVIGDSLTMPAGVALEDAYHSRLERWLNDTSDYIQYEFINFGVGGYQLRQYWAVLTHKASAYDPDLILIGFCARNDFEVMPDERFAQPYKVKPPSHPFTKPFALRLAMNRYQRVRWWWRNRGGWSYTREQLAYVKDIFARFGRYSRNQGVPVVVAYLALLRMPHEPIAQRARKHGLYFVNASADFAGQPSRDYHISRLDSHPNEKANEMFARALFDYFERKRLLDPNRVVALDKGT